MILPNPIDSPFMQHVEQKNEGLKFLRIDADVNETFKETERPMRPRRSRRRRTPRLSLRYLKKAIGNDKLNVKVES